eukprot:gb/GECG01012603.1/.p1 GENE.gb/GECG01012603.1/~~gb/GECG01012603.1/.p1  ORF type:complete len:359 (+),score=24.12 gb/GECG01012603.1/:1-1077(+)
MAGSLALFTQRIGAPPARPSPLLLLAHAGSFCKEVWRPFIGHLDGILRKNGNNACVVAFDLSGHGNSAHRWKPGTNFNHFGGKDVLDALEYCRRNNDSAVFTESPRWTSFDPSAETNKGYSQSEIAWEEIYGIGHSVGGSAVIQAEYLSKGQFKNIVAFEPVIYPPLNNLKFTVDNPLSVGAERRKAAFPSKKAALEYLRDKPIFKTWDSQCLEEFITNGLRDIEVDDERPSSEDNVTLKCDKYYEAQMYRTYPEMWDHIHKVQCLCHVLLGKESDMFAGISSGMPTATIVERVARQLSNSTFGVRYLHVISAMKAHITDLTCCINYQVIPDCGHFMIMERPRLCAEIVARKTGLDTS